jgi:hypothetical protein
VSPDPFPHRTLLQRAQKVANLNQDYEPAALGGIKGSLPGLAQAPHKRPASRRFGTKRKKTIETKSLKQTAGDSIDPSAIPAPFIPSYRLLRISHQYDYLFP